MAVAFYALIGFVVVPWVAQKWVVPMVAESLINGDVQVDTIRTNPFTLSLTLEGVAITDEQNTKVLGLDRLYGNLQASSLFREGFVLRNVALEKPYVLAVLEEDGTLNLAKLFKSSDEPSEPITLPRVRGESLSLDAGIVEFIDRMIEDTPDRTIEPISFTVNDFDTEPMHDNLHRFSAATEAAEDVTWEGQVLLNPLEATGTIVVEGFDLSVYEPYVRQYAELELNQGVANLTLSYDLAPAQSPRIATATLQNLTVTGMDVTLPEHPLLAFEGFTIENAVADAVGRSLMVQGISVQVPDATVQRESDGSLALLDLVNAVSGANSEASDPLSPVTVERAGQTRENLAIIPPEAADGLPRPLDEAVRAVIETANDATQPWTLRVESLAIHAAKARWRDLAVEPNVEFAVADTSLTAGPISTDDDYAADFEVNTTVISGGDVRAKGRVEPLANCVTIDTFETNGLALAPVAPYVQKADPRLRLPSGTLDLSGSQLVAAMGEASADGVAVPLVAVGEFTVGGTMDLEVHELGPPVDIPLRDIGLKLAGLDTANGSAATVDFDTKIYDGNIAVDGSALPNLVEPLKSTIDLSIVIDKFALRPLSPVSGEYVGRAIQEGTLNTKPDDVLTVKLIEQQLDAVVPLRIGSFNFGDKVQSENATSLPVGLAVAILKSPDGSISPPPIKISGDLTDPSVSVAGIVMHALTNVVVGVASSPFQMLGGLVPGGAEAVGEAPDLSFVAFDLGSVELSAETKNKLDLLGKALQERPALAMVVQGLPTRALDEPSLRRAAFVRALQDKKAQTLDAGDPLRQDPATIPVTNEQYRGAVRFAYDAMQTPEDVPAGNSETPSGIPNATANESVHKTAEEAVVTPPAVAKQQDTAEIVKADTDVATSETVASDIADEELVVDEPGEVQLELPVWGTDDVTATVDGSASSGSQQTSTRTRRLRAGRAKPAGIVRASSPTKVEVAEPQIAESVEETPPDSYYEWLLSSDEDQATSEAPLATEAVESEDTVALEDASTEPAAQADTDELQLETSATETTSSALGVPEDAKPVVPFEQAEREVLARVSLEPEAFVALRQRRVRAVVDYLTGDAGLPTSRVVASDEPAQLAKNANGESEPSAETPRVIFDVQAN